MVAYRVRRVELAGIPARFAFSRCRECIWKEPCSLRAECFIPRDVNQRDAETTRIECKLAHLSRFLNVNRLSAPLFRSLGVIQKAICRSKHCVMPDHGNGMYRLVEPLPAERVASRNPHLLRTWIKCIEKSTISVTPMAVEDPHLGRARIKTTATAAFASAVSCSRPSRYSEHYRRDDSTDPSDRSRRALPYRYKSKQSSVFFLTSFVVSPPTRGRERESCSDAIVRSTRERPASQVPRRCFSPLPPFGHRGRCR